MTIHVREVHVASGKLLQFIEEQKIEPDIAVAALRTAAQAMEETQGANNRLLMLAHYFNPLRK